MLWPVKHQRAPHQGLVLWPVKHQRAPRQGLVLWPGIKGRDEHLVTRADGDNASGGIKGCKKSISILGPVRFWMSFILVHVNRPTN